MNLIINKLKTTYKVTDDDSDQKITIEFYSKEYYEILRTRVSNEEFVNKSINAIKNLNP